MINQVLHEGFTSTHRRVGLIFFDILWKALWLFVTAALFAIFFAWIAIELQSAFLNTPGFPGNNPLVALTLARQFWNLYASNVFWAVAILITISGIFWLLLEAYFRSGLLPATNGTFGENVSGNFSVFLATGITRTVILLTAVLLIGVFSFWPYLTTPPAQWHGLWQSVRGVAVIGITILLALVYMLTIADTLIRSDAVRLLGTHMLEVAGLIGILLIFEICVASSAGLALLTSVLYVSTPMEAILVLAAAGLAALFLNAVHSYLLVVRFLSIGIMKRHVSDV